MQKADSIYAVMQERGRKRKRRLEKAYGKPKPQDFGGL